MLRCLSDDTHARQHDPVMEQSPVIHPDRHLNVS